MMSTPFNELYTRLLKDVFRDLAQEQLAQGADAMACADAYAEQGKPDFALAHLLLMDVADDVKRDIFARAYEQRAAISEQKAQQMSARFHRSFPMITLEAQKDRTTAQKIRQGQRIRKDGAKILPMN